MKRLTSFLIIIALAACAKSPESIAPAYVSHMQYEQYSCEQLAAEEARLTQALNQASAQQNKARTNDTIGVIFIGLPVSTLSGDNIADQIAYLKGNVEAIKKAQALKPCPVS